MELLEVVPGREIGKLHVLEKTGKLDGEDLYICRDERGRNIQFVESDIIAQAGEVPEVVEEEISPSTDEAQGDEETPPNGESEEEVQSKGEQEDNLESLMSRPIEDLEGQEIVTILIGVYGDNPPDDLTIEELRRRLEVAGKPEEKTPEKEVSREEVKTKKAGAKKSPKKKKKGGK